MIKNVLQLPQEPLKKEAWNCMPPLYMQALRKPLETDVGITAPRIGVETIMPSLVSIFEVSQASHIQEKDITPLYYFKCLWTDFSIRLQKYKNSFR